MGQFLLLKGPAVKPLLFLLFGWELRCHRGKLWGVSFALAFLVILLHQQGTPKTIGEDLESINPGLLYYHLRTFWLRLCFDDMLCSEGMLLTRVWSLFSCVIAYKQIIRLLCVLLSPSCDLLVPLLKLFNQPQSSLFFCKYKSLVRRNWSCLSITIPYIQQLQDCEW